MREEYLIGKATDIYKGAVSTDEHNQTTEVQNARSMRHSKAATPIASPSLKATRSPGRYWTLRLHSLDKASMVTVGYRDYKKWEPRRASGRSRADVPGQEKKEKETVGMLLLYLVYILL